MESEYLVEKAGSRWSGKVSPPLVAEPQRARFTTSPDCLLGGAAVPGCIPALPSPLAPKRAGRGRGEHCDCWVQQEQTRFRSGARSHAAGGDAVPHLLRACGVAVGLVRRGLRGLHCRCQGRRELSARQEEEGGEVELNQEKER